MIKYFKYLIIIFLISCQDSNNSLKVFEHKPVSDGGEIFGNPRDGFFGKTNYNIILRDDFNDKEKVGLVKELIVIKKLLIESSNSFDSKTLKSADGVDILDGYYTHAFVFNQDTVYSGPAISCWLYKDGKMRLKTACYVSKILKTKFDPR